MTNVSEFERLKPTKTYKSIQKAKKYFAARKSAAVPIMDDLSSAIFEEAETALELLHEIENHFLHGE